MPRRTEADSLDEIAPAVYCLGLGRGAIHSNVYLVQCDPTWTLVDTGSAGDDRSILNAAASLFGAGSPPAAILLTHDHPDHGGSARVLAQAWGCPVWVHPDELPLAHGDLAAIRLYANPLDRWVILPAMRLAGTKLTRSIISRSSLRGVAQPFDPRAELPGLPGWKLIPTPGHTPGHVSFSRRSDRVALTGDALLTVDVNSARGLLSGRQQIAGPPWYATWSRRLATASIASLAALEPLVVAGGHGFPMAGPDTPGLVRAFCATL